MTYRRSEAMPSSITMDIKEFDKMNQEIKDLRNIVSGDHRKSVWIFCDNEDEKWEIDTQEPEICWMKKELKVPSWVIKNKETGEVIAETFLSHVVASLNTEKYEAVPILEHLQGINQALKAKLPN